MKDKGAKELITSPDCVSDLSELLALIQEQSELFNSSVLKKTEGEREGAHIYGLTGLLYD